MFPDVGSIPTVSTLRSDFVGASRGRPHSLFPWQELYFLVKRKVGFHTGSVPRVALAKWGYNLVMYYSYILRLGNGMHYVGHSSDLKSRISEHSRGRVSTTKKFLPIQLIYYSAFLSLSKAIAFEKYLKSSSGFAFRNKHLI